MTATQNRTASRNPLKLPNSTPPGNNGYRHPTHSRPGGVPNELKPGPGNGNPRNPAKVPPGRTPNDAGRAAPGNGTNKPAKTPARPTPGKPMVKEPVGDPKKRMGAVKKLVKKNLKRLAVKGGARLLGALGGPLGMAAVTCADIGFDLAYQAGSALGRRNHPTTPADPGGNKILKKQSDGTYKWGPGPKPSRNNGPTCVGGVGPGQPPGGDPTRRTNQPKPAQPSQPAQPKPTPNQHKGPYKPDVFTTTGPNTGTKTGKSNLDLNKDKVEFEIEEMQKNEQRVKEGQKQTQDKQDSKRVFDWFFWKKK